jgi:hypothetical protein
VTPEIEPDKTKPDKVPIDVIFGWAAVLIVPLYYFAKVVTPKIVPDRVRLVKTPRDVISGWDTVLIVPLMVSERSHIRSCNTAVHWNINTQQNWQSDKAPSYR